jgi:hypothetical protein
MGVGGVRGSDTCKVLAPGLSGNIKYPVPVRRHSGKASRMAKKDRSNEQRMANAVKDVLDNLGYGFQYRVLRESKRLFEKRQSPWGEPVLEFPVEAQGRGVRIDFVLRHKDSPLYMLAECRRAHPDLSDWCFIRSPYPPSITPAEAAFVETVSIMADEVGQVRAGIRVLKHPGDIHHIALEVRVGEMGGSQRRGGGAIDEAAEDVCRGLNGLIKFFRGHLNFFQGERTVGFLPVIFTTAKLWTSGVDLSSADIEDGQIDLSKAHLEGKSWLFYHYHQDPAVKHSLLPTKESLNLQDILYSEYVRTIPIVSPSGIAEFLSLDLWNL